MVNIPFWVKPLFIQTVIHAGESEGGASGNIVVEGFVLLLTEAADAAALCVYERLMVIEVVVSRSDPDEAGHFRTC